MLEWNEVIDYDNKKDYNRQKESCNLPDLDEEILISFTDDRRPQRAPFVGFFNMKSNGCVYIMISANDGMSLVELQNGAKWARFNRP